ncbi:hypothetical protein PPL_08618 [Heterostelium album PN500]|uniref:Septum site-determining protein MinC n=1 Tax=Heterostelium pallidum (strain ATCC 26659 / Pp 5 / PN500) TaxID=670386 RepID=D3BJ93_HETP5|nr:hypothetical protein PPL_08618 [Heterostelium album PN500]EFA77973.1 hypothetical protein PPL_08618 [Heterostelium album PN500]|eukprot:XP_020430101.1 hypothetical protein PPL_08618 [Heterostelium album PN500]
MIRYLNRCIIQCNHNNLRFFSSKQNDATLKSKSYLIPTLKINNSISFNDSMNQLIQKIELAPMFYKDAPIVVDVSDHTELDNFKFDELMNVCVGNGLVPIGVSCNNPSDRVQDILKRYRLPIMYGTNTRSSSKSSAASTTATTATTTTTATASTTTSSSTANNVSNYSSTAMNHQMPAASTASTTIKSKPAPLVISTSLRSGQQIYAENTDLIIMGNVHSGAEAVSDGNIFIFGTLKGRALAGLSGDKSAKIITNKFEAELVSIGPAYHACETLPRTVNPNIPTTVTLQDDKLLFTSIDPNNNK